jgi:hypothetical protein
LQNRNNFRVTRSLINLTDSDNTVFALLNVMLYIVKHTVFSRKEIDDCPDDESERDDFLRLQIPDQFPESARTLIVDDNTR